MLLNRPQFQITEKSCRTSFYVTGKAESEKQLFTKVANIFNDLEDNEIISYIAREDVSGIDDWVNKTYSLRMVIESFGISKSQLEEIIKQRVPSLDFVTNFEKLHTLQSK